MSQKSIHIAFWGAFLSVLVLNAPGRVVLADTNGEAGAQNDSPCQFQSQLETIKSISGDTALDDVQKLRVALNARKNLLKNIIDCAARDADELKTDVESLPPESDGAVRQLAEQITSDLNGALRYYSAQRRKVEDVGLHGSQELSRNIREWRAISYAPMAQKASNFIAWNKNLELIRTADSRLNQVRRTVGILKLLNDEEFQNLFKRADAYFRDAKTNNQKALEMLGRFDGRESATEFIKSALDDLSKTYQEFFTIGERLDKILPNGNRK